MILFKIICIVNLLYIYVYMYKKNKNDQCLILKIFPKKNYMNFMLEIFKFWCIFCFQ